MNFFHLSVGHVSRSTGRSTVQNIAYITGEVLFESRRELRADYANNRGKATWATMAPLGSGIEEKDLSFWDKLESFEDAYAQKRFKNPETLEKYLTHARVGQTYEAALPKELTEEQNVALVREMTFERFVSKGLLATYAINWNEGNPHVHITVSTRTVWDGEISWDKSVSRSLVTPSGLRETRKIFAGFINKHQELAGLSDRVDHRSYADLGIDLIPTHHKGYEAHRLEKEGALSLIGAENAQISEENKQRVGEYPEIILQELTSKQATFTERDVVKLVHHRLKDDVGVISQHVIYSVMREAIEVGVGFDDIKRYTSKDYKAKEEHILESLEASKDEGAAVPISEDRVAELLDGEASWLNAGQKEAVKTLCGDGRFSGLIGRAGTGKTTALQYVVQLHKEAGYNVLGMAPSATAAHELRKGAGCPSDTIAHYAYHWKPYFEVLEKLGQATTAEEKRLCQETVDAQKAALVSKNLPDENTLILVDEIGMVGVGDALAGGEKIAGGWHFLVKVLNETGAKFIMVGDDHQAKPVEAGDVTRKVFRDFKDAGNLATLTEIQRQKVPWMKEASLHLAELRTSEALGMYETQGHVQNHETNADVYQDMARQYLRKLVAQPDSETLAMAYTNEEVRELNGAIRKILKENGLLEREDLLTRKKRIEKDTRVEDTLVKDFEDKGFESSAGNGGEGTEGSDAKGRSEEAGGIKDKEGGKTPIQPTREAKSEKTYAEEGYTVGDKIVFTQNDRGFWTKFDSSDPTFFVRNGMQGRIEFITPCRMVERGTGKLCHTYKISVSVEEEGSGKESSARVSSARPSTTRVSMVSFYLREYSHFQHGYAITIHKTQGATGDGSLIKFSRYMDAYLLYVAMTRHREDVSAYYSKEDFADFPTLLKTLGKLPQKDLAADYSILEENREFWLRVQEYKALGFELMSVRAFARLACAKSGDGSNKEEQERTRVSEAWTTVHNLEEERKGLAKIILEDWGVFGEFARQAGISHEAIKIAAGVMKRPLSRAEEQARVVVEQYASVTIEARQAWHTIRRTHPGTRAKTHPQWPTFEALRNQRGVLANQIVQDPFLYRPFLKDTARAFEEDGGNNNFGYGLYIIKAQAEAHQSKMIQQEMLKDTSDPILSERLQTLLEYVDARDLSASLWKALKPSLAAFKGTLLSEGFCKEIDEWKEMRMARDQRALKIIDSWEDYSPLIQKVGMKLSFETLMDQKEQAVRDTLLKAYATSQEDSAKLHAAFEIKALMDEDRAVGKKSTVSDVYFYGLQPKDITRHALEYQKLKVFESLKTELERQLFLLLDEYDDKCRETNRIYVVCLNEIKEMNGNVSREEERELKPWDAPSWPVYQEACKPRNQLALEIFDRSDLAEIVVLAHAMGLNLKEVELEQVFLRGEKAFRDTHIERYLTSPNQEEQGESAFALIRLINSEKRFSETHVPETHESAREKSQRDDSVNEQSNGKKESMGSQSLAGGRPSTGGRPSSATAKQVYHAGIDFKELYQAAKVYQQSRVLQILTTEEDIKTFHALQNYGKATHLANQAYKGCIEEAKGKSLDGKSLKPADTRVWETEAYKAYAPLATAQNRIAYTLFEEHDVERVLDLSRQMGMSLDVSKFITQVENGMRDFYLETFETTTSDLIKAVSAAELYGLLEADERQGSKKTFGVLKGKGIPASDVRDYAHQFNRLSMIESLSTEAEKELFRLYSNYDYHAVVAKGIYRQCADTRVPDQENLGTKPSESEHFSAYKEAVSERNAAANALVQHPDYSKCLGLVERLGLAVNRGLILSHGEDGFREQALIRYKELSQSPGAEAEGAHAEMRKANLADLLVKMIEDDREEGHKKTLLAVYQAGLSPKDVFAVANELKEFAVFARLETEEERHIFGFVIKYKTRSEKANELYRQCAEESKVDTRREKLNIKVSDNPLYPDYLAAVSARNESATALLECADWEECLLLAEQLGIEIDESKVIAQSRDGQRENLLDQYTHTDSILVKRLIARELKEIMDEDHKEEKKVTVADLYRNNILPRDIQEESRQFDRMVAYSQLTSDAEKRVFSLLGQYGDLLIQSNKHYSASFQEAEEQGVKKEKTASYAALFQESLKEREKMALLIQHAAKPKVIEWMAEEMGVPLDKLDRDCRNNEIRLKNLGILNQSQHQVMRPSFKEKEEEPEWKPILPVPQDAPPLPDQSNYYKREDMRHPYKDAQGNLLGYVVRLIDKKTGKKETPPITWCINKEGEQAWKWKGFGDSNRSLYGLDRLAQYPDKPVLVVEGEKTADVAQKLLPEFVVMTWIGGTGAPHKSNWEPLKGKTVVIWPDNDFDGKGLKAAQKIESIISQRNEMIQGDQKNQTKGGQVRIVALPEGILPNTWDLADDLPGGWTIATVREMIKGTIVQEAAQEGKEDLPTIDSAAADLATIDPRSSEGESAIDRGLTIDLAAKGFISLSEKHEKIHWRDPEKEEIRQALDKLASKYWQDERFVAQIKNSGSEVAASNIRLEIHLLETELSRSQHPVDGQQGSTSSTGATSANLAKPTLREVKGVEMAAEEFVSLTERYEKVHCKDPERNAIRTSLDKIVSAHWQDKRFISKIENSGNELAANKIKIEIHLMETEFSHNRRELD